MDFSATAFSYFSYSSNRPSFAAFSFSLLNQISESCSQALQWRTPGVRLIFNIALSAIVPFFRVYSLLPLVNTS